MLWGDDLTISSSMWTNYDNDELADVLEYLLVPGTYGEKDFDYLSDTFDEDIDDDQMIDLLEIAIYDDISVDMSDITIEDAWHIGESFAADYLPSRLRDIADITSIIGLSTALEAKEALLDNIEFDTGSVSSILYTYVSSIDITPEVVTAADFMVLIADTIEQLTVNAQISNIIDDINDNIAYEMIDLINSTDFTSVASGSDAAEKAKDLLASLVVDRSLLHRFINDLDISSFVGVEQLIAGALEYAASNLSTTRQYESSYGTLDVKNIVTKEDLHEMILSRCDDGSALYDQLYTIDIRTISGARELIIVMENMLDASVTEFKGKVHDYISLFDAFENANSAMNSASTGKQARLIMMTACDEWSDLYDFADLKFFLQGLNSTVDLDVISKDDLVSIVSDSGISGCEYLTDLLTVQGSLDLQQAVMGLTYSDAELYDYFSGLDYVTSGVLVDRDHDGMADIFEMTLYNTLDYDSYYFGLSGEWDTDGDTIPDQYEDYIWGNKDGVIDSVMDLERNDDLFINDDDDNFIDIIENLLLSFDGFSYNKDILGTKLYPDSDNDGISDDLETDMWGDSSIYVFDDWSGDWRKIKLPDTINEGDITSFEVIDGILYLSAVDKELQNTRIFMVEKYDEAGVDQGEVHCMYTLDNALTAKMKVIEGTLYVYTSEAIIVAEDPSDSKSWKEILTPYVEGNIHDLTETINPDDQSSEIHVITDEGDYLIEEVFEITRTVVVDYIDNAGEYNYELYVDELLNKLWSSMDDSLTIPERLTTAIDRVTVTDPLFVPYGKDSGNIIDDIFDLSENTYPIDDVKLGVQTLMYMALQYDIAEATMTPEEKAESVYYETYKSLRKYIIESREASVAGDNTYFWRVVAALGGNRHALNVFKSDILTTELGTPVADGTIVSTVEFGGELISIVNEYDGGVVLRKYDPTTEQFVDAGIVIPGVDLMSADAVTVVGEGSAQVMYISVTDDSGTKIVSYDSSSVSVDLLTLPAGCNSAVTEYFITDSGTVSLFMTVEFDGYSKGVVYGYSDLTDWDYHWYFKADIIRFYDLLL